jgi:hypothetical protein
MPSEKQLLESLEKDTVDTSSWMTGDLKEAKFQMERAEGRLYSLAVPQADGTLRAWHVTDDPQKVVDLLRDKGDFYAREGDLCGGLYVSAVPHFWEGRSNKKWDFLGKLSREARGALYQSIYDRLVDQINSRYITPSEFERAEGVIAQAMTSDYWQVLVVVANQPFNIDIPRMAKELSLATPFEPHRVPVDFIGRYLEFNTERAVKANEALLLQRHGSMEGLTRLDLCNMLKSYGWDGVFTKASMGTNPELVIWSGDKIVTFGDWTQSSSEMSGARSPFVIVDPDLPRFQAWVSGNRTIADVEDTARKSRLMILKIEDVQQLKGLIEGVLNWTEKFFDPRGMSYDDVPSYYTYSVYLELERMDELDLRELLALVKRLAETLKQ